MKEQKGTKNYIAVHLHIYQPPRGDPWTGKIPIQPSAAPFHDWNERINYECYWPNAFARRQAHDGLVTGLINNYEWASFNIGPTLLLWLEKNAQDTLAAIIEGDRLSSDRLQGHGNAIAQVYNHPIMPLESERDKRTQVLWGITTFEKFFNRMPEGMHLAEMAVDTDTLEMLAECGIKYTILSPHSAKAWRPIDETPTEWLYEGIDPSRPYQVNLPSGKRITVFFYDGQASQAVAFASALSSGERLRDTIFGAFSQSRQHNQLVNVAVDGETFGHHHKQTEMCLAWLFDHMQNESTVGVTNYGHFLENNPPQAEVQIHENSSWSCCHGIERWRKHCGCGSHDDWQQHWRKPLRDGLDALSEKLEQIFIAEAGALFLNPWEARNRFIEVILGITNEVEFFSQVLKADCQSAANMEKARALLEMMHYLMLSFTSCAWFFDEISRLEPVQNLCYAARAIEFADQVTEYGHELEQLLLSHLEQAPSNVPEYVNGKDVWLKLVKPLAVQRRFETLLSSEVLDLDTALTQLIRLLESAQTLNQDFDLYSLQALLIITHCRRKSSQLDFSANLEDKFVRVADLLGLSKDLLNWCRTQPMSHLISPN